MRIPVFFSFYFKDDVMRVQQVRNIGSIEGNAPVSPNDWEDLKRAGSTAIKNWIDNTMKYRRCVVVLIGEHTAERPWVRYEIVKAWNERRGVLGVHIHNLRCPRSGTSRKGANPFSAVSLKNGRTLAEYVKCYNPNPIDAYGEIAQGLESWVTRAIADRT